VSLIMIMTLSLSSESTQTLRQHWEFSSKLTTIMGHIFDIVVPVLYMLAVSLTCTYATVCHNNAMTYVYTPYPPGKQSADEALLMDVHALALGVIWLNMTAVSCREAGRAPGTDRIKP
jgi:hypothetical protein